MTANARELTEIALHILVSWVDRRKPLDADVELLRHTFPTLANLPEDELAVRVIHDLSARVFSASEQDRATELPTVKEVA